MSDVVIKVEGLGKQYRYGQSGFSRHSLREALTDAARSTVQGARSAATWPFRRFNSKPSAVSPGPQPIRNPIPLPRALASLRLRVPPFPICNLKSKICSPKTVPFGP
jgi:hypothetical protein